MGVEHAEERVHRVMQEVPELTGLHDRAASHLAETLDEMPIWFDGPHKGTDVDLRGRHRQHHPPIAAADAS